MAVYFLSDHQKTSTVLPEKKTFLIHVEVFPFLFSHTPVELKYIRANI